MQINIKLSCKLKPLILVSMVRSAQITQNNKFAKSLQYPKKEVRDETAFLWNGHHSFLQIDTIMFWWIWSDMRKVLKTRSMQCLCNISGKNWVMKLMFCMLINMKVSYKLFFHHWPFFFVNMEFIPVLFFVWLFV